MDIFHKLNFSVQINF